MTGDRPDLIDRLRRQRSAVVQGFLWILLAVVVGTVVLNVVLFGPRVLAPTAFFPNLVFAGLICAALWLNRRERFGVAVSLLIGITLFAASLPLFVVGLGDNVMVLFLFFIPVVLAGLLLDRRALYLTAGWTLGVVLLAPALQGAGLSAADSVAATDDAWLVALQFAIVYATVTFFLDRFGLVFQATLQGAVEHEIAHNEEATERLRAQEAVIEGQRFNDAIVESLPGIFFVLDESGSYFQWNRNFTTALGYETHEMQRLNPLDLVVEEDKALLVRSIADVFEGGQASAEVTAIRKDGRRVPYLLSGTRVVLGGQTYLAGIGIDRSEIDAAQARIRALNEELEERLERLTALREIDTAITGSMDLDPTLDTVLRQVTSRLGVDAACVLLFEPHSQTLRFGASRGFRGPALRRTELRLGDGLAGRAGLRRERVLVDDAEAFERAFAHASSIEREGFHSYLAVPLIAKGAVQGVLELFHRSPLDPSDDWSDFLAALATQTAIALDNTAMFENLQRSNTQLRLAYDTTIEGWARALDLKDEDTAGHSQRVTALTVRLAERLGMGDEERVHVRRGALLHDIGKMGVPDSILLKPGKLDADEWEIMKRHTTFAYDLLVPIPFLRPALDIPYCHHEKWDGSGYPRGLKGAEIPLAARLFAVVDVYDALISDRPYRRAWSHEHALDYIRDQAGTHFDPAIAAAFLATIREAAEDVVAEADPGTDFDALP